MLQSAPLQPPSHVQPLNVHAPWLEQLALHKRSAHPAWDEGEGEGEGKGERDSDGEGEGDGEVEW